MPAEPYDKTYAKKLIAKILLSGVVSPSGHAKDELAKDSMSMLDVTNVLRAGRISEAPELENGTWRYRIHTERMCVVVAFASEEKLRIVTAWRKKR